MFRLRETIHFEKKNSFDVSYSTLKLIVRRKIKLCEIKKALS